jgi:hypothetical protein
MAIVACAEDPVVPLVQLGGVAPKQIELGDKLEIDGAAFPQGRKARVVFEGALHRPGEIADPDGEIDAQGEVVAPDRIEVVVSDVLLAAFCGAGSSAAHTTFDGSVTVVFAAQAVGAPPVSGNLQHVTLDVLPTSAGEARFLADAEDGEKLARASGLHVEARASGGLVVTNVEPRSRAASAAIAVDDVIVSSNGVRAIGVSDLAPPPGAVSLALVVRRGGDEEVHAIALDGARGDSPRRFALPAAIVLAIAALLALLAAPPLRSVVWFRRRLARTRIRASSATFARIAAVATVAMIPLAMPTADVSVLALVAYSSALAIAILAGSEHDRSSARAAATTLARVIVAAIALGGALVVSGSLRADELVAAQGSAPWEFFALRGPAHAALALVFVSFATRRDGDGDGAPLPRAAESFVATLHAALAVIVFFGGWRVPFAPSHAHGVLVLAATAVFAVKVAIVALLASRVRAALAPRGFGASLRASLFVLAPAAAIAGLVAAAWERHVSSRGALAATTFALVALAAVAIVQLAWPRAPVRRRVDPLA